MDKVKETEEFSVNKESMERVRKNMAICPGMLAIFDKLLDGFMSEGVYVGIKGSLWQGKSDKYSDIDLFLAPRLSSSTAQLREFSIRIAKSFDKMVSFFSATHLGMDNLLIAFFDIENTIVKVDMEIIERSDWLSCSDMEVLCSSPKNETSVLTGKDSELSGTSWFDYRDAHQKFTGWIWYTHTKLARGEFAEAIDSMSAMRKLALIPCIQLVDRAPIEGFRRIEERFSKKHLDALRRTFPKDLTLPSIVDALNELIHFFFILQPLVAERLGQDHCVADLKRMINIVSEHQEGIAPVVESI